jgi:predicted DCC family thiol-disulfide oxidoreductase YuxK
MEASAFTLLYDGACPFCLREVTMLRRRDGGRGRIRFVDIDAPNYDPASYANISYRDAMGRIHGLREDGTVLRDLAVFREAYRLVGLGWVYAPTAWLPARAIADGVYRFWAGWRLRFTGRPDMDSLCALREARAGSGQDRRCAS